MAPTSITLTSPDEHEAAEIAEDMMGASTAALLRRERAVTVDRRAVVDGRPYLRISGGLPGQEGRWVPVRARDLPTSEGEFRLLDAWKRSQPAALTLHAGQQPAFRFDDAGRVVKSRSIAGGSSNRLTTERVMVVGGTRFMVLSDERFAGWAVAEASLASITDLQVRDPS